jgi:hypothetical protein
MESEINNTTGLGIQSLPVNASMNVGESEFMDASTFEDDEDHCDAMSRVNTQHIMPPEGILFLAGEWKKIAFKSSGDVLRSFALDGPALKQLIQLSDPIREWINSITQAHDECIPVIYELHYIRAMTIIVAYEVGRPNPLGNALQALVEIRGDMEFMARITEAQELYSPDDYCVIAARGHNEGESAAFIGVTTLNDELSIELPSPYFWLNSGLGWLWYFCDCCVTNRSNETPWLGRVCDCERPY